MPADSDIDIEALLDAPLKSKIQKDHTTSILDVISHAKDESRRRDHREHDGHHHHRDSRYHDYDRERSRNDSRSDRRNRSRSPRRDGDERRPSSRSDSRGIIDSLPLTESQRDRRTVFVRQLAQRVRSDDLRAFCEGAGKVRDVRLVYDRISNRSKGVAYVEFVEEASVPLAIKMTGQKLAGIPVIIELTETEKNRLAEEAAATAEAARRSNPRGGSTGGSLSGGPGTSLSAITRVFVGGLHPSLDEPELRKVFEPFGDLDQVEICRTGNEPNGTANIHFKNPADAAMAVDQMNGFTLAGRPIRVGILRDRPDGSNTVQYKPGEVFSSNLDDSETQGLSLNAKTRTELMMKLAREPTAGKPPGPSPCVMLAGMYDPEEETELGWEYAISDEVREECTRFGPISHISVAKSKAGEVWLKFASIQAAQAAVTELNGRWFGGRQIKAIFVDPSDYQRRFPK